jgi:2-alkenal reductase
MRLALIVQLDRLREGSTNVILLPPPSFTGRYADPWLDIQGVSITSQLAEALDLPVEQGVLVQTVIRGGPADRAGLRGGDRQVRFEGRLLIIGGDIIVAIDDVVVQDMDDLIVYLADHTSVGQRVTLTGATRWGEAKRNGDTGGAASVLAL